MANGPGRFNNIFKRLDVELSRLKRLGMQPALIDDFRHELLKQKPKDEPPPSAVSTNTTPYQIAFNRLEGFKRGEFTWEYYEKAWQECSEDDRNALNDVVIKGE